MWWYETIQDPKRKRLPINKKPAYLNVVFHVAPIDYRSGLRRLRVEPAILFLFLSLPPFAQSSFLPFLFPPFVGLSFVKLDNLVPSLRAITLDYFCLQSCAPPYTYSLEMIGVELEKENNAWGRAGRARERGISQQEEEGIAERSDDWAFRLIARMCAGRAKGWFRAHARANSNWGIRRWKWFGKRIVDRDRSREMWKNDTLDIKIVDGMSASTGCDLRSRPH